MRRSVCLILALAISLAWAPQAKADLWGFGKRVVIYETEKYLVKKAIRGTAKYAMKTGVKRLKGDVAQIARACLNKEFGYELRSALTDSVVTMLVDSYMSEMADRSGTLHSPAERKFTTNEFVNKPYRYLNPQQNADARKPYNSATTQKGIRDSWSKEHGLPWPKVTQPGIGGLPGQDIPAQIHHNRPTVYGGNAVDPRGMTPLHSHAHQQGVHKKDGMLKVLISCIKARDTK